MPIRAVLALMAFAYPAADNMHRDAMFDDVWNRPIPPYRDRAIIGKIRRPVISELHQAIVKRTKAKADDAAEANISATLERNGVRPQGYGYRRITCRNSLCETIIILRRNLPETVARRTFDGINQSSSDLCDEENCVSTALMRSGPGPDNGTSLLIYFIPRNQGFL